MTARRVPGPLIVLDEGTVVGEAVKLNFIGTGVKAMSAGGSVVNVYIPPPAFLSHWNTADGSNGSQTVTETITRSTVRISTPHIVEGDPFETGGWAGTNQPAHTTGTVTFTTPSDTTGFGGNSNFVISVFAADGLTLLDIYITPSLTSDGVYVSTSGFITVTISSYGADAGGRYKAKASVSVNIAGIIPKSGRYHVEIDHAVDTTTDSGLYTYVQQDVFYDSNPTGPTVIGTPALSETTGSIQTKHISGIEYYIIGSQFGISIDGLNGLNADTIKTQDNLVIVGTEYGLPQLNQSPFGTTLAQVILTQHGQ
jgi:hypothetical protein